jgi:hypothetical protein
MESDRGATPGDRSQERCLQTAGHREHRGSPPDREERAEEANKPAGRRQEEAPGQPHFQIRREVQVSEPGKLLDRPTVLRKSILQQMKGVTAAPLDGGQLEIQGATGCQQIESAVDRRSQHDPVGPISQPGECLLEVAGVEVWRIGSHDHQRLIRIAPMKLSNSGSQAFRKRPSSLTELFDIIRQTQGFGRRDDEAKPASPTCRERGIESASMQQELCGTERVW